MEQDEIKRSSPPLGDTPKTAQGIYLGYGITLDNVVCRYMDFDCLLQLLDGTFYVSAKEGFMQSDAYDAGKWLAPLMAFRLSVAGDKPKPMSVEEKETDERQWKNKDLSRGFLASCWTTSRESYLMWKAYTSGRAGVCIKSCVYNIWDSIKSLKDYKVYCAKMSYEGYHYAMPFADYLFSKNNAYEGEMEVRFYFLRKRIEEYAEEIPSDEEIAKSMTCKGENFKIDPNVMIQGITLSPFMRGIAFYELKDLLERKHPFLKGRIKKSNIIVN